MSGVERPAAGSGIPQPRRVVLATHNQHKVAEFDRIIADRLPGITVIGYDGPEPVEDGTSFAENALIKARAAARHTGLPALADDSGLCVDVMGGAPGIFSAIWSGRHGDDPANVELLLAQLNDIPDEHRGAHFSCAIAMVRPDEGGALAERVVTAVWPGRVARSASGSHGFGYDPIFVPEGEVVTSASLAPARKTEISHRARAFRKAIPELANLLNIPHRE